MAKPNSHKIMKVQSAMRVKQVIEMIVTGMYHDEIIHILTAEWNTGKRNVQKYIYAANKVIMEEFSKEDRTHILSKYNLLYRKALEDKDYKTANAVLQNISKMGGFFEDKLKIEGELNQKVTIIKINTKTNRDDGN